MLELLMELEEGRPGRAVSLVAVLILSPRHLSLGGLPLLRLRKGEVGWPQVEASPLGVRLKDVN